MCGIDFAIGITDTEASKAEKYVHFNEKIHTYLIDKEKNNGNDFKLILNLNPYGKTIIFTKKISQLKNICETLINKYHLSNDKETEIRTFALELKVLCEDAIKQNKHIYTFGD